MVDVTAFNANETNNLAASGKATIMSTANRMVLKFSFVDEDGNKFVPNGDTLYIDRYYNGNLAETQVFTMSENSTVTYAEFSIITVGLHEFTIRDLAGRTHVFAENKTKLSVYMVNQILYTVNDKEPINNQIFNNDVRINIISKLSEIPLYDTNSSLFITVTHNGISTVVGNNGGVLTFSEPGSYSVKMSANTILANTNPDVTDASVMSVYNFVIIKPNIAQRSFNISKGTGFIIEKIVKIVGSQRYDLTDTYEEEESLIWLQYADNKGKKEGNSIWDITLKKYNEVSNTYDSFSFKVWINDENPIILSNIPEGTSSKENIIINYNAAQIYSQVGNAYITVNGVVVVNINENSSTVVDTISISEKGSHMIKIYKEDGTLISSYKFVKTEPLNNVTKIILICAAIGVVIVVVLFFLLRRKGKYR